MTRSFYIAQNDCHRINFFSCVNRGTTNFKRLSRDVYGKCFTPIEKNILMKGECNKWYNTKIKITKRNMRNTENKYWQDKTNELKNNEFRRIHQLICELVARTKTLYY